MAEHLGDMAGVLKVSDGEDKCEVYAGLGITLTYQPDQGIIVAEARPPAASTACTSARVGGGT
jgi:hypothetical protein